MAVKKPDLINGNAQAKVVQSIASESRKAAAAESARKEYSRLEEQRRQAAVDLDTEGVAQAERRMKEIRAAMGKQTVGDRVSDALSGALNTYVGPLVNAAGTAVEGLGAANTRMANYQMANSAAYRSAQNSLKYAQQELEAAQTEEARAAAQKKVQRWQSVLESQEETAKLGERLNKETAEGLYQTADTLQATGEEQIGAAKQGLGTVGQFAVDVGVAGAQMAGDVGLALLTGGSALVPMAARGFGSGAQEARQSDATIGQQMAYGAGSAAVSVATEKLANVAAPFKKAFGPGVLDKALSGALQKLEGNAAGKLALSMLSEGGEEFIEDVFQPVLQRATYASNPYSADKYGAGNVDLSNRPQYQNEDGSISTVDSVSFNIDGQEILLPAVWMKGGKPYHSYNDAEIIQHYYDTGEYLGKFDTPEEADAYAQKLHEDQDQYYNVYKSAAFDMEQALYDAAVGAVLGGVGSGIELAGDRVRGNGQNAALRGAGTPPAQTGGRDAPTAQRAAGGVSSDFMTQEAQQLFGQQKAASQGETAFNENGLASLTEQEKINLSSGKKNKVITTFQEAVSFVKNALSNKQNVDRAYLGKVPDAVAQTIQKATGLDIRGFGVMMNGNDVRHIMKDHGDILTEQTRGQVAVTADDIARIPDILSSPDRVYLSGETDTKGRKVLVFEKQIGDKYISIQGISDGKQVLQTDTLYIRKGRTRTTQDTMPGAESAAPVINAQGGLPQSSSSIDPTIPQGADAVKFGTDGLGAADAGSLNSGFDRLQAESDAFHPINMAAAQQTTEQTGRAPTEVPVEHPETGMNIQKTVSTILNSPLTSNEMAPVIEQSIAGGKLDYAVVTDRAAMMEAQRRIQQAGGYETAARNFIARAELGQRMTKDDFATGVAAYNEAVKAGDKAAALELTYALGDAAHDGAQVTQAVRLLNRLTPAGKLLALRRMVDKMNARSSSGQSTRRGSSGIDLEAQRADYVERRTGFSISDELAADYLMAETEEARAAAWDAITTDLAAQIPNTIMDKWNAWRYTAMLTNPTTHVRNMAGNVFFGQLQRRMKNLLGAGLERAMVRDQGQRTKSVLTARDRGLREFARSQYETDQAAAMGEGKYQDRGGIAREIQAKRKVLDGPFQKLSEVNSGLLDAEDLWFNRPAYVDSFAQALKAKGVTAEEAASGAKAELVQAAREYAVLEAQKATFRDSNDFSDFVSSLGRYEGESKTRKVISVAVDAELPFRRTPANVLVRGVEYSPAGLLNGLREAVFSVRSGKVTAAEAADHLASGLTGTGIFALGAYLASQGLLTLRAGGGDDDEHAFLADSGFQDFALQIGEHSYTLEWLAPAAMPLFAGAAMMEAWEGESGLGGFLEGMKSITDVVLETSMLSSLDEMLDNTSYAKSKAWFILSSVLMDYVSQGMPTFVSKIASAMDDTVRKAYVSGGTGEMKEDLLYFLQGTQRKIPGFRETMQPKVDLWGDEVSNGSTAERILESFLSPGYYSRARTGKITEELTALADRLGSSAVYPDQVERSFKVGQEMKYLTAEEYTQYAKKVGQTRKAVVTALIENEGYQKLTDEEKAKAISKAYEYATAVGKMDVSEWKPGDSSLTKGALNSVLPPATYILYTINADRDNSGSVNGTESALTLQELTGITDRQRGDAWAKAVSNASEAKNPFVGALPQAGIDTDTAIDIYDKYRTLSNADGMKAKEKAAEFKRYINGLGLSREELKAVKNTYKFFGSYLVEW